MQFSRQEYWSGVPLPSPIVHAVLVKYLCCCRLVTQSCLTLWDSTPGFPVLHYLLELAQTHVHWVSDAIQTAHPLLSLSPPQSFPALGSFQMSQLFTSGGQSIGVLASTSVLPMNIQDWFHLVWTGWNLLAVQGTLKRLLQHHSSKASILWHSAFFIVQLSHPYMATRKTIALTRRTFVDKVMSLLLNMLSRLVITFLPRSKCLLISWLQSPSVVILEPPKIKSVTVSILSPSIWDEVIKKQRHYFANKGLSSQSFGFSSGHVWMWELD